MGIWCKGDSRGFVMGIGDGIERTLGGLRRIEGKLGVW